MRSCVRNGLMAAGFAVAAGSAHAAGPAVDAACAQAAETLCAGRSLALCFAAEERWTEVPVTCIADVQALIEAERGGAAAGNPAPAGAPAKTASSAAVLAAGRSYGGRLRAGPGQEFEAVGRLSDGDAIEILADSGVVFDGYTWFRIRADGREAFHWGGILCAEGTALPGTLRRCE
jgi:hypothetical protein